MRLFSPDICEERFLKFLHRMENRTDTRTGRRASPFRFDTRARDINRIRRNALAEEAEVFIRILKRPDSGNTVHPPCAQTACHIHAFRFDCRRVKTRNLRSVAFLGLSR